MVIFRMGSCALTRVKMKVGSFLCFWCCSLLAPGDSKAWCVTKSEWPFCWAGPCVWTRVKVHEGCDHSVSIRVVLYWPLGTSKHDALQRVNIYFCAGGWEFGWQWTVYIPVGSVQCLWMLFSIGPWRQETDASVTERACQCLLVEPCFDKGPCDILVLVSTCTNLYWPWRQETLMCCKEWMSILLGLVYRASCCSQGEGSVFTSPGRPGQKQCNFGDSAPWTKPRIRCLQIQRNFQICFKNNQSKSLSKANQIVQCESRSWSSWANLTSFSTGKQSSLGPKTRPLSKAWADPSASANLDLTPTSVRRCAQCNRPMQELGSLQRSLLSIWYLWCLNFSSKSVPIRGNLNWSKIQGRRTLWCLKKGMYLKCTWNHKGLKVSCSQVIW